jgi:hypothetical protein
MENELISNTTKAAKLKPRKRNIAIYLDEELIEAADDYGRVTGTNRSWVFRSALMRLLEELPRPAKEAPLPKLRGEPEASWSGIEP